MKKLVLIAIAALFLSACGTQSTKDYPYVILGEHVYDRTYCKSMDEEKRIAYDCIRVDYDYHWSEYHLAVTESWIRNSE